MQNQSHPIFVRRSVRGRINREVAKDAKNTNAFASPSEISSRPSRLRGVNLRALRVLRGPLAAFTIIELMVVVLILAIAAGLLVPAINRARRSAQVTTMKLNFQAIATGLEAYRQDFGDYPKAGTFAAGFPGTDLANTPRVDATLAMALIGPGPASLINTTTSPGATTGYTNADADGADGPGFKTSFALVTSTMLSSTPSAPYTMIAVNATPPLPTTPPIPTIVSLGGPGSPDAHVPIASYSGSQINLEVPLQGPAPGQGQGPSAYLSGATVGLLVPAGRTWGPYLPVDKLKVAYVSGNVAPDATGNVGTATSAYLPVLLDIWGNPILYFPAYNTYTNHINYGSGKYPAPFPQLSSVAVGPLLGSPGGTFNPASPTTYTGVSGPTPAPAPAGQAVFWDGTINWPPPSPNQSTPQPASTYMFTTGQRRAILYKLGDLVDYYDPNLTAGVAPPLPPSGNILGGMILPGGTSAATQAIPNESLAVQQPYFMISAGPDGIFTDLYYDASGNPINSASWQSTMNKSDDVYSFDQ